MANGKWLVTGSAGFCGSALVDLLVARGCQVFGVDVTAVDAHPAQHLDAAYEPIQADLADADAVHRLVADVEPDYIAHLAALTNPAAPLATLYEANVYGTVHLLDAVKAAVPACMVLIAGSSAQYGLTSPDENPITEAQSFRPITHYAVTKATQDLVGAMYSATGLRVIRTRTFNIVGPRQKANFVSSAFAKQIAEIERGLRSPLIEVGNLAARRDFVDVRDVVRAYGLALVHGRPGAVYNVCSGKERSVRELLDGLLALSKVADIDVRQVPDRLQAADLPTQVGSYERLAADTGWRPEITWEQMMQDLLDYWREVVAGGG
jgi:GDP-4-dehydro-6-deoxy-D-mannose reductase